MLVSRLLYQFHLTTKKVRTGLDGTNSHLYFFPNTTAYSEQNTSSHIAISLEISLITINQ
jgi:hypothetical protein